MNTQKIKVRIQFYDFKLLKSTSKTLKGTREEIELQIRNYYDNSHINVIKVIYL